VECQPSPPTKVDSVNGALYSVSSVVTIVLIDKQSNVALGSIADKSKGIASTEAAAFEKPLREVKLDRPELVSLLEKAKN